MPRFDDRTRRSPQPDRSEFFNPWNERGWIAYMTRLLKRFQYIQFLGLPVIKDNPDVRVDEFYVPMRFASHPVPPSRAEDVKTRSIEGLLEDLGRLIVLGDPGSGKSTLVKYLATMLASRRGGRLGTQFEDLIPLPIVLRDLHVDDTLTFESLWEQFCHQPFWPDELSAGDLTRVLHSGQALVMVDGLDEVGSRNGRKALRDALLGEGMSAASDCLWLLTSRVVGYDDVPFVVKEEPQCASIEQGMFRGWPLRQSEGAFESTFADPVYAAPFTDAQIGRFVETWYAMREADPDRRKSSVALLKKAIHGTPEIQRLARVPNLLTIMALIYRVKARLPNGRAILFDEIAQAYLESIDEFYGIRELDYPLSEKKRWLARVGFEMQSQRAAKEEREKESKKEDRGEGEILADAADVKRWVVQAMRESNYPADDAAAGVFVDHVSRRSGLLLPRGPDQFAFLHLSFQEYFAACHLQDRLQRYFAARFLGESRAKQGRATENSLDGLPDYVRHGLWRETLVFLFEMVAESPGLPEALAAFLFGENFKTVRKAPLDDETVAVLLARLVVDPHSGLPQQIRNEARDLCSQRIVRHHSKKANIWEVSLDEQVGDLTNTLLGAEGPDLDAAWKSLLAAVGQCELTYLSLKGAPITDLGPLAGLTGLQSLGLIGTSVSDLSPLAGLTGLQTLVLTGASVSDLSPLAGLTGLQWLYMGNTSVSDLSPLAGLTGLQTLDLTGASVSDLSPLAGLTGLRTLDLDDTSVSDLSPLAGLTGLKTLYLSGTSVSDLSPLAGLARLGLLGVYRTSVTKGHLAAWEARRKKAGLREVEIVGL